MQKFSRLGPKRFIMVKFWFLKEEDQNPELWNEAADANFIARVVERGKGVLVSHGPIKLLIPRHNKLRKDTYINLI